MSEDNQLDKVSIQDLEKKKLQAETDILRARLATEYPLQDTKKSGFFERVAVHVKGWSAFILGAVTLISAVWGVFVPLSEYLVERRKALEYELNENMIGFVDDLNSDDPNIANRGVMMLSYYEVNSIPILLFFLEGSQNEQAEFRDKIIETISLIYEESNEDAIFELIHKRLQNNFQVLLNDHIDYQKNPPEGDGIKAATRRMLFNYMDLINGMTLKRSDQEEIEDLYSNFKSQICQDETLEIEIFGIFSQICIYLGEEISCE